MTPISHADYCAILEDKLKEELGYPLELKYRGVFYERGHSFKTPAGSAPQADYIFLVENKAALVIEAEPSSDLFETGKGEAIYYAINYEYPRGVPYIMVAAGEIYKMYEARPSENALMPEFEELPQLLTWDELQQRVKQSLKRPRNHRELGHTTLDLAQLAGILGELEDAIKRGSEAVLLPDQIVENMNEILIAAVRQEARNPIYDKIKLSQVERGFIENRLETYCLHLIDKFSLAYAYRQFVVPYFKGKSSRFPQKIGRYFTLPEIIDFMVNLVNPQPEDRIIDFACGSGGFLGAAIVKLQHRYKEFDSENFLRNNLFGCDIDPFCVSVARTYLELLLPGPQKELNVFHHNGLYSEGINGEDLIHIIQPESFDLIISNPPGNEKYCGTNEEYVAKKFGYKKKFTDYQIFIRRAVELAKPEGKICLLVPEGILANPKMERDRESIQKSCEIKAVISLPRVFPFVPSRMSILYMVKRRKNILLASVPHTPETVMETELNEIYKTYRSI